MTLYEEIVQIQDDVLRYGKDMSNLLVPMGQNLWAMKNHPHIGVHRYTSKMQPTFHGKITDEEMFELGMAMTTADLHGIFSTHDVGKCTTLRHVHPSTVTFIYTRMPAGGDLVGEDSLVQFSWYATYRRYGDDYGQPV